MPLFVVGAATVLVLVLFVLFHIGIFRKVTFEKAKIDSFQLAYLRHVGPYSEIGKVFGKLQTICHEMERELNQSCALMTKSAGVYLDNPNHTDAKRCRSVAGIRLTDLQVRELSRDGGRLGEDLFKKYGLELKCISAGEGGAPINAMVCQWKLRRGIFFLPSVLVAVTRIYGRATKEAQSWSQDTETQGNLRGCFELYDDMDGMKVCFPTEPQVCEPILNGFGEFEVAEDSDSLKQPLL
eukprot:gnl/TRDRNA2_/TRDRNA2_92484_c0_seq1.p1 gnl/TRDRNA2_/TRDRNA2_92484_c0~~gnl/TRDRNA2_/TRDRNA2_92484_c0_seq1.p1  ORF type:complete len:239 (+),score=32.23 gnl/TRDRNA2_/TRDRNA2_92484_c0_seq1:100-816(+)